MLDELALLVAAMPERLRIMLELAAWCALRSGEGPSCAEVTSTGGFRLMLPLATLSVFFGPGSLDCRSLEHRTRAPGPPKVYEADDVAFAFTPATMVCAAASSESRSVFRITS